MYWQKLVPLHPLLAALISVRKEKKPFWNYLHLAELKMVDTSILYVLFILFVCACVYGWMSPSVFLALINKSQTHK